MTKNYFWTSSQDIKHMLKTMISSPKEANQVFHIHNWCLMGERLVRRNLIPLILSVRSPRELPNYINNLVRDSVRVRCRQTSTAPTRVAAAQAMAPLYMALLEVYFDIDF